MPPVLSGISVGGKADDFLGFPTRRQTKAILFVKNKEMAERRPPYPEFQSTAKLAIS